MRRHVWSRVAGALATVLGAVALPLAVGAPAQAAETCGNRALSRPFSGYGDSNDYFLATSGTFESGTYGWSTGPGVSRVNDNNPWRLSGNGYSSLRIPGGASASTATMCLAPNEDSMRFFVKSPGSGSLLVTVKATDMTYGVVTTTSFTLNYWYAGWYMTTRIALPNTGSQRGNQNVQITFTTQGSAAWQMDDLFIDPSRTI